METITTRLESFDIYHQHVLQTIREDMAIPYSAPPTVHESPLSASIEDWLLAGNRITHLELHESAGHEAITVMLQSYANQSGE